MKLGYLKTYLAISSIYIGVITVALLGSIDKVNASGFKFTAEFCKERGLGNNWYCEPAKQKGKEVTAKDILSSNIPGEQKTEILNYMWETYRKRAVMDGKQEDIDKFLEVHNTIAEQAKLFAYKAQKTVESNPKYFETSSAYKAKTDWAIEDAENSYYLKEGSKRYIIVMIYIPGCPSCIMQVAKVQEMKSKWGYRNLGISIGEGYLEGFDDNISDPEVLKDEAIKGFPTLILMDKEKQEKIFLSNGLTTTEEIEKKAVEIIKGRMR